MQPVEPKNIVNHLAKLQWACRRGMLELDVLLSNFLKERYESLSPTDKELFVHLLNSTDPEIFAWLIGQQVPEEAGMKKITDMIRQHARSRV